MSTHVLHGIRYSIRRMTGVRAYVTMMRPYLLFVSGITGIAGMSLVPDVGLVRGLFIALASFLSYGFGQALTDCFQTDTDALSAPYRPLIRGQISRTQAMTVSIIGLVFCIAVLSYSNTVNLALGILAGIGLATYTPFKRRWWAGPWYNAWIVVVLCLMGFLAAGGELDGMRHPQVLPVVWIIFFGYANFVLAGYFKDIRADRATGYQTLPVVHGRFVAALVSDAFAGLSIAGIFNFLLLVQPGHHSLFTYLIATLLLTAGIDRIIRGHIALHRVQSDEEAFTSITRVVVSYVFVLAGITVLLHPEWLMAVVAFCGLFLLTLGLRPSKYQI